MAGEQYESVALKPFYNEVSRKFILKAFALTCLRSATVLRSSGVGIRATLTRNTDFE